MSIRSRLFATVAFPLLSLSVALPPAIADDLMKPFQVAQEDGAAQPADEGDAASEELMKKRKERAERRQQQQAEPSAAESGGPSDEEKQRIRAERRKQREAEQQGEQAQQPADNGGAAEGPSAEEKKRIRAERRKQQQDAQQPDQAEQPAADGNAAGGMSDEEKQRIRAERRKQREAAKQGEQAEQPAADGNAAGGMSDEEKQRIRAERRKQREAAQQGEQAEQPADDGNAAGGMSDEEKQRIRAERRKQREAEKQGEQAEQPAGDDNAAEGQSAEEKRRIRAERRKQQQQDDQQQGEVPTQAERENAQGEYNPALGSEQPRRKPSEAIVDKRTEKEKKEIARDPARSDDTVVLPVDNGAAVLDSDKDADNSGGEGAREKRRQQRERARAENQEVFVPKSDADSQSGDDGERRRPSRQDIDAANREEGRRIDRPPEFNLNDMVDAFTGNDRGRPRIREEGENRTVIDFGDQVIVRSDDRPRLRRNAEQSYYEELPRGRTRETIERPGGIRVVTVYNQYGDVLQRSRIDGEGREYLMVYAPEEDDGPRRPAIDIGDELPPMRLGIPVDDYIIDTSSQPDRDYYDFLAEPPVERVERVYSIDEVRNSARIRDKVRRIDLDTITFATGSAEVPLSQAKTLRKVADAMLEVIEKDPGETFFIEGHTDAVGSDQSNLVLSDERAESVASLLSDVYDIPAENLVTQGYGERFLKVRTTEAAQENRRVTIRRVTPLVRPVAQN